MISPFLKEYIKSSTHTYRDSVFTGTYIYAVGQENFGTAKKGLVTKLNMNGNVIWEKNYFSASVGFETILLADNGDLLISGYSNFPSKVVCRIDDDGILLWIKRYTIPILPNGASNSSMSSKFIKLNNDAYVLFIKINYSLNSQYYEFNHIIKLDGSGNITAKKIISIPTNGYYNYTSAVTTDGIRIMLMISRHFYVELIILDASLNIYSNNALHLNNGNGIVTIAICDVNFVDNQFVFNGHISANNDFRAFIAKVPLPSVGQVLTGNVTVKLLNSSSSRCYFTGESGNYYLSRTNNNSGRQIVKLDSAFNVIWYKGLNVHTPSLKLSTSFMLVAGDQILGCLTTPTDLASCKTVDLPPFAVATDSLVYNTIQTVTITASTAIVNTLSSVLTSVTSQVEDVCAILVPTFTQVAPICAGAALSPLPTTSLNGISGSWSPAMNNQATTTYTFTPSSSNATATTMTIVINPQVTPQFTQVQPIYTGNSLSPLPTTSLNGITGSWSPALNNQETTTYTFTPNAGQCANTATMTIVVNPRIVPTFIQVASICAGAALSPLPTTSLNGISGSWSLAMNNQATTTYTFTPSSSNATATTMTIVVNPQVTPQFTQVQPIYTGNSLSPLPTTSLNGITGSWSPALNNQVTTTYTFTPNAGQCANTATMTIVVNPRIVPTFTQVTPICAGAALSPLPTTSLNGISGSWSPAMNNQTTTTYTFTPSSSNATATTMTIVVNPQVTPQFTQVQPIYTGNSLSPLPTTSLNGITGSWSPALNNQATTTYTFTPNAGQCANTATMTIVVKNRCVKDEKICDIYSSIRLIITDCLKHPDIIEGGYFDFSEFRECIQHIVNLIKKADKDFPQYDLLKILEIQISILEIFIKKPNAKTYTNAWNSVQYLLDYFSQLGNCNCENTLIIKDYASIQSGSLYLQAAGSVGDESTKGVHLRWTLKGVLEGHLPKANYATPNVNFNKNNDFIRIYRTKYEENKVTLNLGDTPTQINETASSKNWVYTVEGKLFYMHFKNTLKYNTVRNQVGIDPAADPLAFIENYGNSLIEIETKTELSFAISPKFINTTGQSNIKVEVLSVEENKITAGKGASLRRDYTHQEINQTKLISENIRSIRFRSYNAYVTSIEFEFYSDLLFKTMQNNAWSFINRFALTTDAPVAFDRLEPQAGVLSNWLRYRDGDLINVENYRTRWNGSSVELESRIEEVVKKYIELSDIATNPFALETVYTNNNAEVSDCLAEGNPEYSPNITETQNGFEISNLHLLQMGSLDFHVARMLGLGHIDLDSVIYDGQYIYLSEYVTSADLGDGLGARELQHLYCSLPTGLQDQRLPIPVELIRIENGIFYQPELDPQDSEAPSNALLTDADGLSLDGKTQFYTFFSNDFPEEDLNAPFYYKDERFVSSELTIPVFAGLTYREDSEAPDWRKPGLSYDGIFKNADLIVLETKPIIIPENGNPIYIHRERISGTYDYTSYGINWFSRASNLGLTITKTTKIKPKNTLLPPSNVVATLIQKERPLLLTSASEQVLYKDNPNSNDKTLVRLTFEYNHAQELIDYHHKVNGEVIKDFVLLEDAEELFADDIHIKFRNQIPNSISGKVVSSVDGINPLLCVIQTGIFPIYSSGAVVPATNPVTYNENITPVFPAGMEENFIGSILLVDGVEYVIHEIEIDSILGFPKFTVFKSDISGALVNMTTPYSPNLIKPAVGTLFAIVENMQNEISWGTLNPPDTFKVNIDLDDVHTESNLIVKSTDCSTNTYIQKFRGVFEDAQIEKIKETVDIGNDDETLYEERHLGLYKITFLTYDLAQHGQYRIGSENSVEWYNGIVRLHTWDGTGLDSGYRKNFKVIRTENIGTTENLILYIEDLTFPKNINDNDYSDTLADYKGKLMADNQEIDDSQKVNYYPGYKVYLYKNSDLGLTSENVLPQGDEDVRYTMFGLKSHDDLSDNTNETNFYSAYSVPAFMFAQAVKEPVQPQKPTGGFYATRPDFFGKSSYTLETVYGKVNENAVPAHRPHSVQYNRASDVQFLSAIYDNSVLGYSDTTKLPILNTVQSVLETIFMNGEEDFYVNRWNNLLGFNYDYTGVVPNNSSFPNVNGKFIYFEGRQLPMPNNKKFIEGINTFIDSHNEFYDNLPEPIPNLNVTIQNDIISSVTFGSPAIALILETEIIPEVTNSDGTLRNSQLLYKDFLRDVLHNCFVPLTEVPVIYDYIKPKTTYKPIPKKQVVRDRNGQLLKPTDIDFDMAPMTVRYQNSDGKHATQFTDFGLDGASNAKYFYAVREISKQMKTSPYSTILGPISLVNTAPPTAPEILKIIPVLENRTLGIQPSIQLEINSYPEAQNIRKISIYRADNAADALTVRTMKVVRVVDLEVENITNQSKWIFTDDFSDLPEVPFGDFLYYRLTVSRIIRYNDFENLLIVDYAPSEASKMVLTNIVENYSPESPIVAYASEPITENGDLYYVNLFWNETVYKGNYHVYKMNSQGNWVAIGRLLSDRVKKGRYHVQQIDLQGNWNETAVISSVNETIYLPLELTNLNTYTLSTQSQESTTIYHHFKVIAENTAGMFSTKENLLSIYDADQWNAVGGLGEMIVEGTFIIR
jgi:hypothetical protein